ncbi:MAG: lysophospholipid acyltransferase family protein [Campylobacterota bacterium]
MDYAKTLLGKLKLNVKVINEEKIPKDGQFLLVSNHRSVIDPLIVELAIQNSKLFGHWISKKELYNSFFFGVFVRNGGAILLDREKSNMSSFFSDIKKCTKAGDSIFIFPEGTRNKSDNDIGEFKSGSQIIALKNRLNILPVFIRSNANEQLMSSLKDGKAERMLEIEIGDIIEYKDKSMTLEEAYKSQFNLK